MAAISRAASLSPEQARRSPVSARRSPGSLPAPLCFAAARRCGPSGRPAGQRRGKMGGGLADEVSDGLGPAGRAMRRLRRSWLLVALGGLGLILGAVAVWVLLPRPLTPAETALGGACAKQRASSWRGTPSSAPIWCSSAATPRAPGRSPRFRTISSGRSPAWGWHDPRRVAPCRARSDLPVDPAPGARMQLPLRAKLQRLCNGSVSHSRRGARRRARRSPPITVQPLE